jgi:hypothetical protein
MIRANAEALASTYESTRLQNPEEHHHPHRRENLKSLKTQIIIRGPNK